MKKYEIDFDRTMAKLCSATIYVKNTKRDPYYETLLQLAREAVINYKDYLKQRENDYDICIKITKRGEDYD